MVRLLVDSILNLYLLVLFARVILSWVTVMSPQWQPRGILLVLANAVYALTDPPLRWLSRWFKPVRIGQLNLDLAFLVLLVIVTVARTLNQTYMPL